MSEKEEFSTYFRTIQIKFSRFYALILTEADLTLPQYALLNQLAAGGAVSMTDISEKLHITKPAVTNLTDRLETNKFIKRIEHPNDRRVFLLEIQPKGEKIVRRIQTQILEFLLKTLNRFEPAERKTIIKFYALLAQNMEGLLAHTETTQT